MKLDDVKKLHQKKYRSQFGFYLVEGEHLILELFKAQSTIANFQQVTVYVTEANLDWANQLSGDFTLTVLNDKQMSQISDTKTPQGMIARVPLPGHQSAKPADHGSTRYIYLHEVQDPGNLGTILRTLAWFGDFVLLLSANSVDPYNSKVVRASMGAIFHLPIEVDVPLSALHERFASFAYLDLNGESIHCESFTQHECYLFGNEARGVPHDALKQFNATPFTIKGAGAIESLNLASAVSICSFQLSQYG